MKLLRQRCIERLPGASDGLKETCLKNRKNITKKRSGLRLPPKPNVTRWGSTYHMLVGILKNEIRESYQHLMGEDYWNLVEELTEALAPVDSLIVETTEID